jgi:hypothetical protein
MNKDGGLGVEFPERMPRFHWTTIKARRAKAACVPDAHYCVGGVSGWLWYKATEHWAPYIAPEQQEWSLRQIRAGGRVFVAVRRKHDGGIRKGPPVDELWLIDGALIARLAEVGLSRCPCLDHWSGGPENWRWPLVGHLLEFHVPAAG